MCKKILVSLLAFAFILFTAIAMVPAPENTGIPTFVINLDKAKIRLKQMNKKLNGINFTRVSAKSPKDLLISYTTKTGQTRSIDQLSMEPAYLYAQKDWNPPITIHCSKDDKFTWTSKQILSPGEFSCFCSHRALWKHIVKNKLPNAMIFEDDAKFTVFHKLKLHFLYDLLPKQYDLLDIRSQRTNGLDYNAFFKEYIIPKYGQYIGTESYIVSYAGAKKLLAISEQANLPVDQAIGVAINKKQLNAFTMNQLSKISLGQEHLVAKHNNSIIR